VVELRALAIVVIGSVALGVTELPIDDIAKLGVSGSCLLLVWWLVAKSIPTIIDTHTKSLDNLTMAYRQSVADLRELHKETSDTLVQHLDGVRSAITQAAQSEAALLRELIKDKHS
jgi:hypothetical protein